MGRVHRHAWCKDMSTRHRWVSLRRINRCGDTCVCARACLCLCCACVYCMCIGMCMDMCIEMPMHKSLETPHPSSRSTNAFIYSCGIRSYGPCSYCPYRQCVLIRRSKKRHVCMGVEWTCTRTCALACLHCRHARRHLRLCSGTVGRRVRASRRHSGIAITI